MFLSLANVVTFASKICTGKSKNEIKADEHNSFNEENYVLTNWFKLISVSVCI